MLVLDSWRWYLIINLFSRPQCMNQIHWFGSWASLTCLEFLGFGNSWLGKIPLGLSLIRLACWFNWVSILVMAWVSISWVLIKISILLSKLENLVSICGFWKEGGETLSRPASQNTWKRSRDDSRRHIYGRKISYVYTLNLK